MFAAGCAMDQLRRGRYAHSEAEVNERVRASYRDISSAEKNFACSHHDTCTHAACQTNFTLEFEASFPCYCSAHSDGAI